MIDLKKYLIPVKIGNTDQYREFGNFKFNTTDLVFLDSKNEATQVEINKRLASLTDYALANGAVQYPEGTTLTGKKRHYYWLRDSDRNNTAKIIYQDGRTGYGDVDFKSNGICPTIHLNLKAIIAEKKTNPNFFKVKPIMQTNGEILYYGVEFGNYPKTKAKESDIIESYFLKNSNFLKPTGKKYIGKFDDEGVYSVNKEYSFMGEKYVRVKINTYENNYCYEDGTIMPMPTNDNYVWIKVEPITWIIRNWDEMPKEINPNGNKKAKFINLRTEESIISGVPFYPRKDDSNSTLWQNSTIRGMLNGINVCNIKKNGNTKCGALNGGDFTERGFLKEAFEIEFQLTHTNYHSTQLQSDESLQNSGQLQVGEQQQQQTPKQSNPYNFVFDKPSNDDLLSMYVKSNASVFLHGPSGVGKSGRVKQLDPNATRITLRPQMNPEEIDGTLDRETGKFIQPLWYTQLTEKCKAEPDKKHVLFIDELTNVKPTVQSLVYSIVLDRAGKDGLWPLPDNAVVVAAGNENAGNLAAYPLTNALYRRFSHIYYEVDKDDWLDWATSVKRFKSLEHIDNSTEKRAKIHPAIIAYIICRDESVLNQDLDEENPKIVTDPRKWEIASNILYSTKNPNALLPAIGPELTTDFIDFVQNIHLSVEDVKNGNYVEQGFQELDISKKLSTIVGLCIADEKDLPIIRKFIAKTMGKEILATYDSLWIKNDPERAEILAESNLNLMEDKNNGLEY